jgi:hypothetical protein
MNGAANAADRLETIVAHPLRTYPDFVKDAVAAI